MAKRVYSFGGGSGEGRGGQHNELSRDPWGPRSRGGVGFGCHGVGVGRVTQFLGCRA